MRMLVLSLILALLAAGCGGPDRAEGTSGSAASPARDDASGLAYLASFVGRYPYDVDLWNTQPLNARLQALLGEQYPTFVDNMEVQGPLEAYGDGVVWTSGNKAHQGGIESAMLLADTRSGALEVYLLTGQKLWHHAEREPRIELQGDAATMVGNLREAAERR